MNNATHQKKESSCSNSVSFPNTRSTFLNPFESKFYKFQPVRSDVLLKQFLEEQETVYKSETSSTKPKTSHIVSITKNATSDSFTSDDDDANKNILDKTIIEDDSILKDKDLVPGVTWLDSPPKKATFKIVKSTPSSEMSDIFKKLSIKDQASIKKSFRPASVNKIDEVRQLTGVNKNIFKTPTCNKLKIISSCQKLTSSNALLSNNQILSTKKRVLEPVSPKQKVISQKKNFTTPSQNSILQTAAHRNYTPRLNLPSTTKDKIIPSAKKLDTILHEKNMNIVDKQKNSEKKHSNNDKQVKNSDVIIRGKQKTDEENCRNNDKIRKPISILQDKVINVEKQMSEEEKCLNNEEPQSTKQSVALQEKNEEHKQMNKDKQIINKPKNEDKQVFKIPQKALQETSFQQLKVRGKDFIVINKIGEGGSGQVYRCLEQETLQDRAIKVVNLNVDPTTLNGYINEVKMLKELQGNDRVIKMFDFEKVNQTLFVVMEKGDVDFSIFLRNITAEPQIQTHVIVCYWIEMLKCVREIHKKGIIHSDLKPSNFLIVAGRLKLIDFGIASRLSADMTSVIKNVTVGTFNYISPEALLDSRDCPTDGKPQLRISYKSDVWSLGCILYQMVYKRTPFQSATTIWAKYAIITDKNHKIEYQHLSEVPLYLIDMIKKCLVYDMRSRPTVDELLNMYYSGNNY